MLNVNSDQFELPRTDCIHTGDMDSEWPMIFIKEAFLGINGDD
jgi:hypothetical protein